jgi:hypothetical protein
MTALAVIAAGVAARFRNHSLPLGLRGIHIMIASGLVAAALPIIRRLYVKLYPDLFWVWDEVLAIAEKCPSACYRESRSLGFRDLYSWPTLLNKGDELTERNHDWTDARGKELFDKAPGLFELIVEDVANPNDLGFQLSRIVMISHRSWKLVCHSERLMREIERSGSLTEKKSDELMYVSRLVTEMTFMDLTLICDGNLSAMGEKFRSQKSPHYIFVFALPNAYWALREKAKKAGLLNQFFEKDHPFNSWREAYNKVCEDVAPLWDHTSDGRYKLIFQKDESAN